MKRTLKRIISLAAALVLCVGMITVSPVAADSGTLNDRQLEAMDVLRLFEIVPEDYYDYNVNMNQGATRADFAVAVANLLNLNKQGSGQVYYYDVPQTNWAFNAINALTEQGILSGEGNKLFRPDDVIEKEEAYKILVSILGYGELAEYTGGYPAGYDKQATRLQIIPTDISEGTQLTRGDMFLLFYNAMTTEVLEPVIFGDVSNYYNVSETDTLLSIYHSVYYEKGILTGADNTELYGASIKNDEVRIGGINYHTQVPITEYLGEEIEFFYYRNSRSDESRILWAKPTGRSQVINITANHNASFDKETFQLKYTDDATDRERRIALPRGLIAVYNGGLAATGIDEIFNEPRYTAKLVNNGNGYDVAIIRAYRNILVRSVDPSTKMVYDKLDAANPLSLDESLYEYISVQSGGENVDIAGIASNYVISVYLSKDNRYLEAQVSANQVSGTIESITREYPGFVIKINGEEYFYTTDAESLDIKPGDAVTLFLDVNGEVAGFDSKLATDTMFAWIVAYDTVNYFTPALVLRIYTDNNEMIDAKVLPTVNIDGENYRSIDSAKAALLQAKGSIADQLVRVRMNEDKEIQYIDTAYNSYGENGLTISSALATHTYMGSSVLGPRIRANTSTKVFIVPNSEDYKNEVESYNVTTLTSYVSTWTSYKSEGYIVGSDKAKYTDAVVIRDDILGTSSKHEYAGIMIVAGQGTAWDEEKQMEVPQLIVQSGANTLDYKCADGYDLTKDPNIREGNVIKITTNKQGEVNSTSLVYGTTTGETPTEKKDTYMVSNWTTINQSACGYITDVANGMMTLSLEPDGETGLLAPTNVGIAVYDPSLKDSVYSGSEADLASAMNSRYKVIIAISRGTVQSYAVIKE